MRRSLLATVAISVLGAFISAGCGSDGSGSESGPPADVVVKAESGLKFDADSYTATAGSDIVEYVNDDSQLHTLVIDGVDGFKLRVTGKGKKDRDTLDLKAGSYTLYCDVPGHREGGMEADLTVS